MDFAGWNTSARDLTLPFDYKLTFHYPGFFFSSIFYIGLGTSIYFAGRALRCLGRRVMTYFKTVGNGSKYV